MWEIDDMVRGAQIAFEPKVVLTLTLPLLLIIGAATRMRTIHGRGSCDDFVTCENWERVRAFHHETRVETILPFATVSVWNHSHVNSLPCEVIDLVGRFLFQSESHPIGLRQRQQLARLEKQLQMILPTRLPC